MIKKKSITATILAGGQGYRMNGLDKGWVIFKNKPLFQHVIDHIRPQVNSIMISCNRNLDRYQQTGLPVFQDDLAGYLGPLAGIYSGLLHSQTDWNLMVSCDTPFLPDDLVNRLFSRIVDKITDNMIDNREQNHPLSSLSSSTIPPTVYVFDGERYHPTILLIHKQIAPKLKKFLENGDRKLQLFLQTIHAVTADFSDKKACFININSLDDLHRFEHD